MCKQSDRLLHLATIRLAQSCITFVQDSQRQLSVHVHISLCVDRTMHLLTINADRASPT